MDVNKVLCGDHFPIYTYIESLCFTSKTNEMFYVNSHLNEKNSVNDSKQWTWREGLGEKVISWNVRTDPVLWQLRGRFEHTEFSILQVW